MSREELLNKLHNIKVGAIPTVITDDMGLQYEYATPDGHDEGFGGMGDWPTYCLEGLSMELLEAIKEKIRNKTLELTDLENTDLLLFHNYVFSRWRPDGCIPTICDFFKDLENASISSDGVLYAMCDAGQWTPVAYFFDTYDELEEAFVNEYASYVDKWEDLSDDELQAWVERVEDELDTIPFVILRDEENEENAESFLKTL